MTLEIHGTAASMNSLDRVWEALDRGGFKPTRRANTFKALCPVHGDANPSLSVRYDPQAGKIALHCFGCEASVADITAQLSLTVSDLFDAPLPADRRTQNRSPRPKRPSLPPRLTREELATPAPDLTGASWQRVKAYEYVDDNGVVQQRVHREETVVDGIRHKRFTQSYRGANGRFVKRKPEGFAPLLYNLRAVTTTVADGGDVWLLEGEKDADNAIAQGLVATTNAGGATAFPAELVDRFRGGRVHLVVDNDHAGYKRAASVTAQLLNERIEARAYLPSLTERKADFTDHLESGGTIDTLVEISVDDATALDAAAEAAKLLGQVEICLKEARAQLDASDQDRATAERNAEAWARESAQRLDRITSLQPTLADTLSERAEAARDELAATISAAAGISRDTFALAGLDIPQGVVAAIGTAPELEDTEPDVDERPARDPRTLTVTFQTGNGTGGSKGGSGSTGGGRPRFDGGDSGKRATIKREEYDVVDGITVSVKWAPADEAGEDGKTKWEPRYTAVLNGWAEIETVAVEDDGTDSEIARAPHMISIRFYRYVRDARGSAIVDEETEHPQIESTLVKFDEEQLRTGTWSQALPWPNLIESTTRRGKDQAWDAIRKARQTVASNSLVYTTLGWRTGADGQPFFVHSTGAIGQDGAIDNVEVKPSLFNVFALPAPSTDAEVSGQLAVRRAPLIGDADQIDDLLSGTVACSEARSNHQRMRAGTADGRREGHRPRSVLADLGATEGAVRVRDAHAGAGQARSRDLGELLVGGVDSAEIGRHRKGIGDVHSVVEELRGGERVIDDAGLTDASVPAVIGLGLPGGGADDPWHEVSCHHPANRRRVAQNRNAIDVHDRGVGCRIVHDGYVVPRTGYARTSCAVIADAVSPISKMAAAAGVSSGLVS